MPIGPARMPLLDHLGELRRRFTIILFSVFVTALIMYFATPVVVDILKMPIAPSVAGKFYITSALGGFTLRFSISFKVALIMCTPMILWQILGFFLPALKPNERRWVVPTVLAATALFFIGALFCYLFVIPPCFQWLIGETKAIADPLAELTDYLNIELLLLIGFGIAFELPLVIFYLSIFHIVPYTAFRAQWRYIYVVMVFVSACVSPDASPVTCIMMYAALIVLYESSLAVARLVIVAREGKAGLSRSRLGFFTDDEDE
ncbi:Sec-independent protein translocase, TatC subunit [Coriobacterium glomerans PW2]|uniref:Sec-independent protein translocase protein TatC n=1 Tax=Coriobacterium glomerans (strain ATCC 49209 / DSM 20642 / JCM 10262 / PW2) TaxID=700015 RepID=F2N8X0_CORGP|nr:twin-arginine translocase subunit TatC [Coriobacterium glomerans]AEB07570.1 Sec-independent protein translocase, TatC subunit [Coriobacterium glomerans PW2]